jgi:hypothetical protein
VQKSFNIQELLQCKFKCHETKPMHFLLESFPKKARMRSKASRFGGFHWYKTKQNKTNKLACFIDTLSFLGGQKHYG